MANLFRRFPSDDLEFDMPFDGEVMLFYQEIAGEQVQEFENGFWEAPIVGEVGQAAEAESALGLTAVKRKQIGIVTESESALGLTVARQTQIGLATESESALGLTAAKRVQIGIVTESESALAVTRKVAQTQRIGLAVEAEAALGMLAVRVRSEAFTVTWRRSLFDVEERGMRWDVPAREITYEVK